MHNDDYIKWYIKALKAYDDGHLRESEIEAYALYLQQKNKQEKPECSVSENT